MSRCPSMKTYLECELYNRHMGTKCAKMSQTVYKSLARIDTMRFCTPGCTAAARKAIKPNQKQNQTKSQNPGIGQPDSGLSLGLGPGLQQNKIMTYDKIEVSNRKNSQAKPGHVPRPVKRNDCKVSKCTGYDKRSRI